MGWGQPNANSSQLNALLGLDSDTVLINDDELVRGCEEPEAIVTREVLRPVWGRAIAITL